MQTTLRLMLLNACLVAVGCQKGAGPQPMLQPEPASSGANTTEPSATAVPVIALKVADKEELQKALDAKRGHIVLVDFWATWCAPCKKAFPHTVEIAHKYQDQGLAVISVSMDDADAHEEALKFLTEQKAEFTNLRSQHGAEDTAFAQFEIDGGAIPHLKLYDREGKLVKKFASGEPDGVFTPEDIELAIRELIGKS
jgi:thiol-disulfide isomerase/thioredoxin